MSTLPKLVPTAVPGAARGSASALYHVRFGRLQGMNASERTKVIACLANLLMQAAGVVTEERDDDER
jgi:hypothetical protein